MVAGGRVGRNRDGRNCHTQHTQPLGPVIAANNFKAIWVYLTAPIPEALSSAGTYSAVKLPEQDSATHEKHSTAGSFGRLFFPSSLQPKTRGDQDAVLEGGASGGEDNEVVGGLLGLLGGAGE
ncbi:hypothetical protein Q3G72_030965 [Acer saccharum]|nr:hypothetical protein Q3G72_030965 [Acer saccharum]